jgi:cobyrinic acid a,c-diamide synthase
MSQMPRIAVGTIQSSVDRRPILWGLLDQFARAGLRVQPFQSQSRLADHDAAATVMRLPSRYLDPWLMSPETCREFLWHGSRTCELALIEGCFEERAALNGDKSPLGRLAEWLDAPRIAIVDAAKFDGCACERPRQPLDGVLLLNVEERSIQSLRTCFESLWGAPLIGVMSPSEELTAAIGALPEGEAPSRELCAALGRQLNLLRPKYLMAIAAERRLPAFETRLFREGDELDGLRAAVACDDAFPSCFPETLDLMELHGASIECFSPLADDGLPEDTNLVLLGDGRIERFVGELASNHCLKHSLQAYVREGGRIYAEGGGLAWLGRQVVLTSREALPMAGVLPTIACRDLGLGTNALGLSGDANAADSSHVRSKPLPVELTLANDAWLGEAGVRLRGYLDDRWRISSATTSAAELADLAEEPERRQDFFRYGQVIGSHVMLHFAAQREFLERLFLPSVEAGLTCRV